MKKEEVKLIEELKTQIRDLEFELSEIKFQMKKKEILINTFIKGIKE